MAITEKMRDLVLRQTCERWPHMMSEILWSTVADNPDFNRPPLWVAKAVEKAARPAVEQLRNIPKLLLGQLPLGKAGEMAGELAAKGTFLENPGADVEAAEKMVPELGRQRETALKIADQAFDKLAQSGSGNVRKLTVEETAAFLGGQGRGASAAAKELETEETLSKTICMMMWLFWPTVETMGNRPNVHRWLDEALGIRCTLKLVEKVCDEIGFRPAKRGRPKNPMGRKKTVGINK